LYYVPQEAVNSAFAAVSDRSNAPDSGYQGRISAGTQASHPRLSNYTAN